MDFFQEALQKQDSQKTDSASKLEQQLRAEEQKRMEIQEKTAKLLAAVKNERFTRTLSLY